MEKAVLICEARRAYTDVTDYENAENCGLRVQFVEKKSGRLGREIEASIQNVAAEDFLGVIQIKAAVKRNYPKIFMPGYMYGRNTGEKPNGGRKEFPRIRETGRRPESPFWMTRSDRLAEPVSLLYDGGRVVGIAGAPYWVEVSGKKVGMPQAAGVSGGETDIPQVVGMPGEETDALKMEGMSSKEADALQAAGMSGKEADLPGGKTGTADGKEPVFYQYSGFTCHVAEGDAASVGYTLGYENAPWLFIQTATVKERAPLTEENAFLLKAGEEVKCLLLVYDYPAENELGIYEAIKEVYFAYHQKPRRLAGMNIQKAAGLLAGAVAKYAWLPDERMYTGFVYDTPEGYTYNKIGSLTWTNGLAVAAPMLLAANRLQEEEMRSQALSFIEQVVKYSKNPKSGFLYDAVSEGKWSVRGWWYDGMHSGGHSGYLNGQAVYYILKSYLSERKWRQTEHADWISFVEPVITRMNQVKNTDGEYPFSMSEETGAGLEYDSLGGAWCLAATALFCLSTGERRYLEEMKQSEQHYYDAFVKKAECYGGPLDTDKAVDNEGILAFVRVARMLHELTGEEKYLEHLRDGIYYELSFKLGYNTPVQVKPLCDIGWSSCGGSITSTANPHIHPMSSTIVDEMLYLTEHGKDDYVEERLKDTLGWGMQTFNTFDKEYGYGRIGWMSERFCFCQGLVVEKYPDGTPAGTWFALMPWASASVIEGFVGKAWEMRL